MEGSLWIWSLKEGKVPRRLVGPAGDPFAGSIICLTFSPDGKRVLFGASNTVRLWDIAGGKEVQCLKGHDGPVRSVAFLRDGRRALSGSTSDNTIREWDLDSGKELRKLQAGERADALSLSPDEKFLVTTEFNVAQMWDLRNGKKAHSLKGHDARVLVAAYIAGGKNIVSSSSDADIHVWDAATGKVVKRLDGKLWLTSLAVSPDDRWLILGGTNEISFWDLQGDREIKRVKDLNGDTRVSISHDGRFAVSAESLGRVRLWELPAVGKKP